MLLYLYILYIALKTVSHLFFCNPCFRNLSVGDMLNPRLSLSFFTNHLLCPEAPLIIRGKGSYSAAGTSSREKSEFTRGALVKPEGRFFPSVEQSAPRRQRVLSPQVIELTFILRSAWF